VGSDEKIRQHAGTRAAGTAVSFECLPGKKKRRLRGPLQKDIQLENGVVELLFIAWHTLEKPPRRLEHLENILQRIR
jgi:hypothetical protein